MGKIKTFFQSKDNRHQFKTFVIGLAVLVATFSATLLTGWIASLKSAPTEVEQPNIVFERSGDLLTAKASEEIESWQYVGPRRQSNCNETIFSNFLGVGQTFKEGAQLRLQYERDNNKYYCFKAVNEAGVPGFEYYHVVNLAKPLIAFEETSSTIAAVLDDDDNLSQYPEKNERQWQYVALTNQTTPCSETAFSYAEQPIVRNHVINLADNLDDLYYCFRLQKTNGEYVYQTKFILANQSAILNIKVFSSGDRLYIHADEEIKSWAVAKLEDTTICDVTNFDDEANYHLNYEQIAVMILRVNLRLQDNYCIRAQNPDGLFAYKKYEREQSEDFIQIRSEVNTEDSLLKLIAENRIPVENWRIARVSGFSDCNDQRFESQTIITETNTLTLEQPLAQTKIYCFQAAHAEQKAYAIYFVASSDNMLGIYNNNAEVKAVGLLQNLTNWHSETAPPEEKNNLLGDYCPKTIGSLQPSSTNSNLKYTQGHLYCFVGMTENGNNYYSPWIQAQRLDISPETEEYIVILAHDIGLTELSRFVLYQAQPTFYENLSQLREVCGQKAQISCFIKADKSVHILKKENNQQHLTELKTTITQVIRWHYLTPAQRQAHDQHLLLFYQQNMTEFEEILPDNFYDNHMYLSDFINAFHTFLITKNVDWGPTWQHWQALFFR